MKLFCPIFRMPFEKTMFSFVKVKMGDDWFSQYALFWWEDRLVLSLLGGRGVCFGMAEGAGTSVFLSCSIMSVLIFVCVCMVLRARLLASKLALRYSVCPFWLGESARFPGSAVRAVLCITPSVLFQD